MNTSEVRVMKVIYKKKEVQFEFKLDLPLETAFTNVKGKFNVPLKKIILFVRPNGFVFGPTATSDFWTSQQMEVPEYSIEVVNEDGRYIYMYY